MSNIPASVDPAPLPRRRVLPFGTAFVAGAVVMGLLTLLGRYLDARGVIGGSFLVDNPLPLTQANMNMGTLIMSSFTVQWAAWAIARDARGQAYLALGITALMGLAFINQTSFLFRVAEVTLDQPAGPYFYAVTVGHLGMVVAALLMLAVITFKTLGGQYSSTYPDGLSALAIFWQAMVAAYAVIWIAVYVMK